MKLKSELKTEEYVIEIERKERSTGELRRGRWVREKEWERVCLVCLSDRVEDEKHFLLDCPRYVRERVGMFERIKEIDGELEDLEKRMNN